MIEIYQLAFVIVLNALAVVTSVVAYPVVYVAQRRSGGGSVRAAQAPSLVQGLKKTE